MRAERTGGFTLLEVLLVLAIIGILAGVSYGSYVRWQRSLQLVSAATQLEQDISRARSLGKRTAADVSVTVTGARTYTLQGQSRSLPDGVAFASTTVPTLTFQPPFGTLNVTGLSLPVSYSLVSLGNAAQTRTVRVVNLFGTTVRP